VLAESGRQAEETGMTPVTIKPDYVYMTYIEPYQQIVKVTVSHRNVATDEDCTAISLGWPAVLANLKSLLETGHVLPQAPWEMHAAARAADGEKRPPVSAPFLRRQGHQPLIPSPWGSVQGWPLRRGSSEGLCRLVLPRPY
jgi:hypothetical protein